MELVLLSCLWEKLVVRDVNVFLYRPVNCLTNCDVSLNNGVSISTSLCT